MMCSEGTIGDKDTFFSYFEMDLFTHLYNNM